MELKFHFVFQLFFILFATKNAHFVPLQQWESAGCAKSCTNDPFLINYSNGKSYLYNFETKTDFVQPNEQQQTTQISGQFELSSHSNCEMVMQMRNVDIQGVDPLELKQELQDNPIQFGLDDGKIVGVCTSPDDSLASINIKKGILSALQMSSKSLSINSIVTESDIFGECETEYEPISKKYSNVLLKKTKLVSTCSNRQFNKMSIWPKRYQSNSNKYLPLMNVSYECQMKIDKDIVMASTCHEQQRPNFYNQQLIKVDSIVNIRFVKMINGLSIKRMSQTQKNNLHLSVDQTGESSVDELQFVDKLRELCSEINDQFDLTSPTVTQSFQTMINSLRTYNYNSINRLYQSLKSNEYCQSNQLTQLFLDAVARAGNDASVKLFVELINRKEVDELREEVFYTELGFITNQVQPEMMKELLPIAEQKHIKRQALLGVTSLIYNYCQENSDDCESNEHIKAIVDQLIHKLKNTKNEMEQIVLIKSLENTRSRKALDTLLELSMNNRQPNNVRVEAINSLKSIGGERMRNKLMILLLDEYESNEVRIAAYKSIIMSRIEENYLFDQIETLLRTTKNPHVRNYIETHLKNLQKSHDPHKVDLLKKYIDIPPKHKQQQSSDLFLSRNIEYSYLHDSLNLGVVFESDLIYSKKSTIIPRIFDLKFGLPVFGRNLKLFGLTVKQNGYDDLIERIVRRNQGNYKQIINDFLMFFSNKENFIQNNDYNDEQRSLQLTITYDEKTLAVLDTKDVEQVRQRSVELLNKLKQQIENHLKIDESMAFVPINTEVVLPTVNGWPVKMFVNGTVVLGLKGDVKLRRELVLLKLQPAFAVEMTTGLKVNFNKQQKTGFQFESRLTSSPLIDTMFEIKNSRLINFRINLPKEQVSLLKYQTQLKMLNANGQVKYMRSPNPYVENERQMCTKSLHKPLGIEFCGKMKRDTLAHFKNPIVEMELVMNKVDPSMTGFEFSLELPSRDASEMRIYRVSLNTPNSRINRELSAEVQLMTQMDNRKEIRIQLKSPWKRVLVSGAFNNQPQQRFVTCQLTVDNNKLIDFNVGLDVESRGRKTELRPKIKLSINNQQNINLQGSISVLKGRKNQLQIDLHDVRGSQSKQYLKGSLIREFSSGKEFRISSDISLSLPVVELRVSGLVERQSKLLMKEISIDYQLKGKQKQNLKFSGKLQNLSSGQLTKLSYILQVHSTEVKQMNWNFQYNLLKKPNEHLENELILIKGTANKIVHLLQISKLLANRFENELLVDVKPINVNYQLELKGEKSSSQMKSNLINYKIDLIGKDRNGIKSRDIRGSFEYKHDNHNLPQKRLQLSMEAFFMIFGNEYHYKDELKEIDDNEYRGNTEIKYNRKELANVLYHYRIKTIPNELIHHELDMELKMNKLKFPVKHSALFKYNKKTSLFDLKSRMSTDRKQLYNIETQFDYNSPQSSALSRISKLRKLLFEGLQFQFELNQNQNEYELQLITPDQLQHKSSLVWDSAQQQYQLNSETKRQFSSQSEFTPIVLVKANINGQRHKQSTVQVNVLDVETQLVVKPTKQIEFKLDTPSRNQQTNIQYNLNNKQVTLKSQYQVKGENVLDIDGHFSGPNNRDEKSYLNVDSSIGQLKVEQIRKQMTIGLESNKIQSENLIVYEPRQQYRIKSNLRQNGNEIYNLDINNNQHLKFNYKDTVRAELNNQNQNVDGQLTVKTKRAVHQTEFNKNRNELKFESKSHSNDYSKQQLYNINGQINNRDQNGRINYQVYNNYDGMVQFDKREKQIKVEYNDKKREINHFTQASMSPEQIKVDSNTKYNQDQYVTVESLIKPRQSSHLAIKTDSYETTLKMIPGQQYKIDLAGKESAKYIPNVKHSSVINLDNQNWDLNSRTTRFNRDLLRLDGRLNHRNQNFNLNVNYKNGRHEGQIVKDSQKINIESKHNQQQYQHQTELKRSQNDYLINSIVNDQNQNKELFKLDSKLRPNQLEKLLLKVDKLINMNYQHQSGYEPGKLTVDLFRPVLINHQTTYKLTSDQSQVDSMTRKEDQVLLELKTKMLPKNELKLEMKNPLFYSNLVYQPQRQGNFELKTERLDNKININNNDNDQGLQVLLNTVWNNQLLVNLKGHFNQKINFGKQMTKHSLNLDIPQLVELKSELRNKDQQWKSFDSFVDMKLKRDSSSRYFGRSNDQRRIVTIVDVDSNKNEYKLTYEWDKDRDQTKQFNIQTNYKPSRRSWVSSGKNDKSVLTINGNYMRKTFNFESRMTSDQMINGPHQITLNVDDQQNQKNHQIKVNHVFDGRQLECKGQYLKDGQVKFMAEWQANIDNKQIKMNINLLTSKDNSLKLELQHRHNRNEIDNLVNLMVNSNIYGWALKTNQNQKSFDGQLTVNNNNRFKRTIRGSYDLQATNKQNLLNVQYLDEQRGKLLELKAKINDKTTDPQSLETLIVDLDSQLQKVPSVKLTVKGSPKPKAIHVSLDVNRQNKLDTRINTNEQGLDGHWKSAWTYDYQFSAKGSRSRKDFHYEVNIRQNQKQLFVAKVTGNKVNDYQWNGDAIITKYQTNLAQVKVRSDNSDKYSMYFETNGLFDNGQPIKIKWTMNRQPTNNKLWMEICQQKCSTINVGYNLQKQSQNRYLTINVKQQSTGREIAFDWSQQNTNSRRNCKMLLNVNGDKIGYDFTLEPNKHSLIKVIMPWREFIINVNWDRQMVNIDVDAGQEISMNLRYKQNNEKQIDGKIEMMIQNKWQKPKSIQVQSTNNQYSNYQLKTVIDLSDNRDKELTFQIETNLNQPNQYNQTVKMELYNRNRNLINYKLQAHYGIKPDGDWSTGYQINYMNKYKQDKTLFHLLSVSPRRQQFEQTSNNLYLNGKYQYNQNNGFDLEFFMNNKQTGRQRMVNLKLNENCLNGQVNNELSQNLHKLRVCLNQTPTRLLDLNVDSLDQEQMSGQRVTDLNVNVDVKGSKVLKLTANWDPNRLGMLLHKLAQIYDNNNQNNGYDDNGLMNEIKEKSIRLVRELNDEALQPVAALFSDEINAFVQQLAKQWTPIREFIDKLPVVSVNLRPITEKLRQLAELAKVPFEKLSNYVSRKCRQSETCESIRRTYQYEGVNGLMKQSANKIKQVGEQTQQLYEKTKGQLVNYVELNIKLPKWLNDWIEKEIEMIKNWFKNNKYLDDLKEWFDEIKKDLNLSRFQQMINDLVQFLIDGQMANRLTQSRVLLYDPQQGELQLEVRQPAYTKQLQMVINKHQTKLVQFYHQLIEKLREAFGQQAADKSKLFVSF